MLLGFFSSLTALVALTSGQQQQQATDLVSTAEGSGLTELVQWLRVSRFNDTLQTGGPYTLLAPSNRAFSSLPPEIIWTMKTNTTFRNVLLLYHLTANALTAAEMVTASPVASLQGELIQVFEDQVIPNKYVIQQGELDASIDFPNIVASNGIMHLIDTFLLPPSMNRPITLEDVMRFSGNLNTFLGLAEAAGMMDALRAGGPQSVFVPTDAAFSKVDASILRQLRQEKRLLKAVILSHLVPRLIRSSDITGDSVGTNSLGELVIFRKIGNERLVNKAKILIADLMAQNGALHIIDGLLLPSINALGSQGPPPTVDLTSKLQSFGLTLFLHAIRNAGQLGLFTANGPMTVLAPSNAAMNSMSPSEVQELYGNKEMLERFIKRHIIPENVRTADFKLDTTKKNLLGENIRLNTYRKPGSASAFTVNGVPLSVMDESALNGVLHVVDSIVPFSNMDLLDVLKSDARFGTFLTALQAADMVHILRSAGPVTVFAPTEEAFENMSPDELFRVLTDPGTIASTLSNHISSMDTSLQTLFSPGLCWSSVKTIGDKNLRIAVNSDGDIVVSPGTGRVATITETDILASNGVVHAVNSLM